MSKLSKAQKHVLIKLYKDRASTFSGDGVPFSTFTALVRKRLCRIGPVTTAWGHRYSHSISVVLTPEGKKIALDLCAKDSEEFSFPHEFTIGRFRCIVREPGRMLVERAHNGGYEPPYPVTVIDTVKGEELWSGEVYHPFDHLKQYFNDSLAEATGLFECLEDLGFTPGIQSDVNQPVPVIIEEHPIEFFRNYSKGFWNVCSARQQGSIHFNGVFSLNGLKTAIPLILELLRLKPNGSENKAEEPEEEQVETGKVDQITTADLINEAVQGAE